MEANHCMETVDYIFSSLVDCVGLDVPCGLYGKIYTVTLGSIGSIPSGGRSAMQSSLGGK